MTRQEDISKKKKGEIVEAYYDLLDQLKNRETEQLNPEKKRERQAAEAVVAKASDESAERITHELANLKVHLGTTLDELEKRLLAEQRKFSELREAVRIESARLTEIHEITAEADSLAALLRAQAERKATFDEEMASLEKELEEEIAQKRATWEREKEEVEREMDEEAQLKQKLREREEEEYQYELDTRRKRQEAELATHRETAEAELEEKIRNTEQDLKEREATVLSREVEYAALKEEVEEFPERLAQAIVDAEERVTEGLTRQHTFERELLAKEREGETSLLKQTISSLQTKIVEQQEQIAGLTQKANEAGHQVQEIAMRAIDGASQIGSRRNGIPVEVATQVTG